MSLRIYTRTGDTGGTGLFGGRRVSKSDARVEAYGAVDELNAFIGLAAAQCSEEDLSGLLTEIQNDLFSVGSDLSTPSSDQGTHGRITITRLSPDRTERLEGSIDRLEEELPALRNFILPGGTELAARVHVCRTVCRRAERRVVALSQIEATNPEIIRYLNRLSDLLFVLARTCNQREGVEDVPWTGGGSPA